MGRGYLSPETSTGLCPFRALSLRILGGIQFERVELSLSRNKAKIIENGINN